MTLRENIRCHVDTEQKYIEMLIRLVGGKKTITDLSKEVGVSDDNAQRMVKKLQVAGYVNKTFAGKYRCVCLTTKGRQAVVNTAPKHLNTLGV